MALMRLDAAVGTVSQLMIFTEPASAVSQPSPTPATHDSTANTAPKISTDAAVDTTNARTGGMSCRSRS